MQEDDSNRLGNANLAKKLLKFSSLEILAETGQKVIFNDRQHKSYPKHGDCQVLEHAYVLNDIENLPE